VKLDAIRTDMLSLLPPELAESAGAYLVFIGTTCIALLLLTRRRWIAAKVTFLLGLLWIVFFESAVDYLNSLGVDSFAEARNFDLQEAGFWMRTMGGQLHAQLGLVQFLIYLAAAVGTFYLLNWLLNRFELTARNYAFLMFVIAVLIIAAGAHATVAQSLSLFMSHSEEFLNTSRNFRNPVPRLVSDGRPITVFVYVGESTTSLNMGLYGYVRDTTPRLDALAKADPDLIVFQKVFSTHVQTSPSLLEALSFALDPEENWLPIHERRRLSIVDVLATNGLPVRLFSTQGMTGTVNEASSILFRRARSYYAMDTHTLGNLDGEFDRPFDDAVFAQHVRPEVLQPAREKRLIFFHSYAGHGEYLHLLPEGFRKPVDTWFGPTIRSSSLDDVWDLETLRHDVEGYDSAIRYIDYSVTQAIAAARAASTPTIFVYFPDHGESIFTDIGHDAARFRHEMTRIPFLVYFNPVAAKTRPDLLEKYRKLAGQQNSATLSQVPSTLLDLLGMRVADGQRARMTLTPLMGDPTPHGPIFVRRTADGITFININVRPMRPPQRFAEKFIETTDEDTRIAVFNVHRPAGTPAKCYEVEDSFVKRMRSRLISDCVTGQPDAAEPGAAAGQPISSAAPPEITPARARTSRSSR
jgi:hypothetical protein